MRAVFHHSENIASGVSTFWFEPLEAFDFMAGQFTQLYVPHDNPDNRGAERWMTISSSPHQPLVGITTSFADEHGSSFKRALRELQPGALISLAAPIGEFVLPKDTRTPLVFVSAGLGITPTASIVSWLAHNNEQRSLSLVRVNPPELQPDPLFDHFVQPFMHAIGARSTTLNVPSEPAQHNPIPHSRVHADMLDSAWAGKLARIAIDLPGALFFLAGPESLVTLLAQSLEANGVEAYRIVTDLFPGYA